MKKVFVALSVLYIASGCAMVESPIMVEEPIGDWAMGFDKVLLICESLLEFTVPENTEMSTICPSGYTLQDVRPHNSNYIATCSKTIKRVANAETGFVCPLGYRIRSTSPFTQLLDPCLRHGLSSTMCPGGQFVKEIDGIQCYKCPKPTILQIERLKREARQPFSDQT